jgi:S-adenosyl-L-methionine hydrolase (adenosine-forming)
MKGVIATRAPGVPVVDVTHGIPPQAVLAGALVLRAAAPYFPAGAVHVAVVDPGVGTARRAIAVETDAAAFVGPDNGVLGLAAPADRVRRVVELADERFFLSPRSRTFDGRDVFAPVAAAIATGTALATLGPERPDMVRVGLPPIVRDGKRLRAEVVYVDHFGNLATSVQAADAGTVRAIEVAGRTIAGLAPTFGDGAPGELVAIANSWGLIEIAARGGSARDVLGVGSGAPVTVVVA